MAATLVIQTAFLGDVVLTTPLLTELAARHGPVDVVTTAAAAPLLETHPAVRTVIPYDKRGRDRGWRGFWRLARRLRIASYPLAYIPHRSLRSALLARLAGVPRRVGFHDGWPSLYTGVRRRPQTGHAIDRLLALADATPQHQTPPTLELTLRDRQVAEAFLRRDGIEPGVPFVALAPGSIWGSKRWPYFPDLAAHLVQRVPVVALGSADDRWLGDFMWLFAGDWLAHPLAMAFGALTLRESAAVIARAAVLVTNDSAPLHLAQAVGTPTVAVFGPTIPEFGFGPRGPRDVALGIGGLPCRPCSRHGPRTCPLGHHRCMSDLSMGEVMHAIEETGALRRRD
jgi:heptosyltransferase-2